MRDVGLVDDHGRLISWSVRGMLRLAFILTLKIYVSASAVHLVGHGLLVQLAQILMLLLLLRRAVGVVDQHWMVLAGVGLDLVDVDDEVDRLLFSLLG